jgi:RNA polymerase sigma-70 factor (ECF subfamily)
LQEVFLTLLVKAPKFKNQEHEKHWLIRVAINKSKDYHRSFWKRMVEIREKDISCNNMNKETEVRECIENLPNRYKEVVLLYYYFGYSIKEIAYILRLKESAVKMRLSRARNKMKIEMEESYE